MRFSSSFSYFLYISHVRSAAYSLFLLPLQFSYFLTKSNRKVSFFCQIKYRANCTKQENKV